MLRSTRELRDYVLDAKDGHIGRCRDFLFDDTAWTVRYMVADTGKWLPKKKVLISPISLGDPDWKSKLFRVELTKQQIENSPDIDTDAPVSREFEVTWHDYYSWPAYWHGNGTWGAAVSPRGLAIPLEEMKEKTTTLERTEAPSHNLRSAQEVTGYHIQAKDGEIGHVEEFILDDSTWEIRYVVVDTRNLLPGKKILVSPNWVQKVDWSKQKLYVDLEKGLIENGPEFDPNAPVNREYEARLYDYYGRPKYWE